MPSSSLSSRSNSLGPPGEAAGKRTVAPSTATRKPSIASAGNRIVHPPPLSPITPPPQFSETAVPPACAPTQSEPAAEERKRRRNAERLRERRKRLEDSEEEHRVAAPPPRRKIPNPPHRQLFLVDGYYCGADPAGLSRQSDGQRRVSPLPQETKQRDAKLEATSGGKGIDGVTRPGVDPAALSNRIGTAPGRHSFGADAVATANTTFTAASNGLPFYVSPSVPPNHPLLGNNGNNTNNGNNNNTHNSGRSASPRNSSLTPQSGDGAMATKAHKSKNLRIKCRFYEPVELQVESISAFIMRLMLVMWYACLISALVIEVIPKVQWSMVNICGSSHHTDLRRAERWSSPCVTTTPMEASSNVVLTWTGHDLKHLHSKLVRFRRVVVSLPTPADQVNAVEDYHVLARATMQSGGASWTSNRTVTLRCQKKNKRCNTARVAEDVLGETSGADAFSFSLHSVPPSLAAEAASGALGIAYQRSSYTVATVVWRYVLLFLSLIHALRFIVFRKFTSTLYEQGWTLTLQIALLWYLDPLFALNIVSWPLPSVLAFIEYRIPTYFMAVLLAYMLSVMTASMAWPASSQPTTPHGLFGRLKAFLARSRNVYDPPMWTKIIVCLYLVCVFVLDIVDACVEEEDWYAPSNSNVQFRRIYWSVIALLLFGGLVCLIMLLYLRNYLGNKPYLESRPQQLACRVFLMIFLSAIVYYIIHCLVFFLLYNHDYSALASQQPFLQLPTLMAASFFVNIMTLVYTSQNRDDNVPIHAKDSRWKHMVWPDTWYRWLARHGGSQYIFSTEVEETRFYRLQFEFRKRQFMAKQKRRQQPSRGGESGAGREFSGVYEPSTTLGTQGEPMQSGFLSMLRPQHATGGTATRRSSRGTARDARWRTDVWETPMPSQPVSPMESEGAGSGGDPLGQHSFFAGLGDTETVTTDTTGEGRRRGGGAASRADDTTANNNNNNTLANTTSMTAGNVRSLSGNASQLRPRDFTAENTPSVSLAARSILNMDRFSTYFLADGGNGGNANIAVVPRADSSSGFNNTYSGGTGGRRHSRLSTPSQSPQREPASAFDAYDVEGPARRRSRLLHSASIARRRDSATLRREQTTTAAESQIALSHTFAGFEGQRGPQTHEQVVTPLLLGSGLRGGTHHTRSRSDGDVPHSRGRGSSSGAKAQRRSSGHSRQSPQKATRQQQQQHQRYQDPTLATSGAAAAAPPPPSPSPTRAASSPAVAHKAYDSRGETDPCFTNSADATTDNNSPMLHAQQSEALLGALRQVQRDSFVSPDDALQGGPHALPTFTATPTTAQPPKRQKMSSLSPRARATSSPGWKGSMRAGGGSLRSPDQLPVSMSNALSGSSSSTSLDEAVSEYSQSSSGEEASEDSQRGRGRRSFFHTLNTVRERLGAVMGAAERNLFEKPARGLDRFEMQIFDAAYRPFQSMHYLPFFNLETAIDCFNISWEAYGVEKSVGDEVIETGIKITPQNVPKTVAHGFKKFVCGCCPAEENSSQDEADDEDEDGGDDADSGVVRVPQTPSGAHTTRNSRSGEQSRNVDDDDGNDAQGEQRQRSTSYSAAVPPAPNGGSDPSALTRAQQHEHEMLSATGSVTVQDHKTNADGSPQALHSQSCHLSGDAVVLVHMAGEGSENNVPKAERSPAEKREQNKREIASAEKAKDADTASTPSPGLAQGGPATTAASPASMPAAATDPNLFPIDVEKYGFTLLLVAEAKEVQVIMVKMDTNAPEHKGKAPRIIIGFRGTANMSNARYDMNIHRVVWREMERVEETDYTNGAPSDMASTIDGASTMGTQHLGCGACLRSCMRATSWRPTCHAGFLSIWKTLKPTVMQRLREVVREDRSIVYRIFTTGHSLGGALASLSAYSITAVLRRLDYPIPEVTVYTYGQPRMGNRTFQRIYNKAVPRSFRIVNESDMVVSMTMFGGYHVGIEVDVDRNGNFIVKPTEIEKLFPPTKGRGLTVINHLMTNYGISLNAIAALTTCPARGLECYATADPEKIAREKARQDALLQLQENRRPTDPSPQGQ